MTTSFQCSVITPERKVLECDATFVAFPAHDGEIGIMRGRAPLVCKLGIGTLRIEATGPIRGADPNRDRKGAGDSNKCVLFVDQGFAQMLDNRLSILTQQACDPDELDEKAAEQALNKANAMKITDEASFTTRANAIQRAQVQIRLATTTR